MTHVPLRAEQFAKRASADCFIESIDMGREGLSFYGKSCFQLVDEREASAT